MFQALSGVGEGIEDRANITDNTALSAALNTQFLIQIGIFTAVPMILGFILEQGFFRVNAVLKYVHFCRKKKKIDWSCIIWTLTWWYHCHFSLSNLKISFNYNSKCFLAQWSTLVCNMLEQVQAVLLSTRPLISYLLLSSLLFSLRYYSELRLQAVVSFITMQLQLCSVYFTFSLGTKTHYFGRTILHGGAKVCSAIFAAPLSISKIAI